MAFASKSAQRLERSTKGMGADSTVTSSDVKEVKMSKSRPDLTGGSLSKGGGKGVPWGKIGSGEGKSLYGPLSKDGGSTYKRSTMTSDSSYTKSGTTREKLGRTGETFTPKTRGNKPRGGGMSQY